MKDTPLVAFMFWWIVISLYFAQALARDRGKLRSFFSFFPALLVPVAGGLLTIIGFGYLCYQMYSLLRTSTWPVFSAVQIASEVTGWDWLSNPTDWTGLHWLLLQIPASLAFLGSGLTLLVVGQAHLDNQITKADANQ